MMKGLYNFVREKTASLSAVYGCTHSCLTRNRAGKDKFLITDGCLFLISINFNFFSVKYKKFKLGCYFALWSHIMEVYSVVKGVGFPI